MAALMVSLSAAACLDSMEPTPTSSRVSVTSSRRSTRGQETSAGTGFSLELVIRNTGPTTIFLDGNYARTEKLVDQKWKLVWEHAPAPFNQIRTISAGQSVTVTYLLQYIRGVSPESVYLERIRGLYRVQLRFALSSAGTSFLPPEESYSQPFVVE